MVPGVADEDATVTAADEVGRGRGRIEDLRSLLKRGVPLNIMAPEKIRGPLGWAPLMDDGP